ncbi:ATP-binding cassette domain-containing protein [Sutcliffiella horikoshii]|uniref:ATP-binding cassette domain-containing protein n=1 Tax=Sutcliffiella horikoshii TaxID=79883 RepID=UPI0020415457|nr:ATP-binding cassette domain-containing protein [Sutcliffiella horikoshii]MCM3617893.1 ATP-binding cassette domain-containing protein [Sutcliffiella horikoshii]
MLKSSVDINKPSLHINVKNINFQYGEDTILKNLSLEINEPGLYALYGKSGCGKTTFINILSLIQKPQSGTISLFKNQVNHLDVDSVDSFRKKIAYFFQDLNLIESLTIRENLKIISLINGQPLDNKKLDQYSDQIQMDHKLDIPVNNLSGGERQRAAFLKVLVFEYPLILLDEPTNNLDEENIKIIMDLLRSIKKDRIIIVVTHSKFVVNNSDKTFDFNQINKGMKVL